MLTIITSNVPDIKPASPELQYAHPAVYTIAIDRIDINLPPQVRVQCRNFRLLTDSNNDPIMLEDGVTQGGEYGPAIRNLDIPNLYSWIATRPDAAEIVSALNTLLTAVISYDQELVEASSTSSSSSGV